MADHNKLAGHPGITEIHAILQQTFKWPPTAAEVTSDVLVCVHREKHLLYLRKRVSFLKLFPTLEPLEFVAVVIQRQLPKSRRSSQYIIVIADRFTVLVKVMLLRRIESVSIAQAVLEH